MTTIFSTSIYKDLYVYEHIFVHMNIIYVISLVVWCLGHSKTALGKMYARILYTLYPKSWQNF